MKTDAVITFLSEQHYENDCEKSELKATGTLEKRENGFLIEYTEPDEAMGKSVSTLCVFKKTLVRLKRKGIYEADFIIEHLKKHRCVYKTPFGETDMLIFATCVSADIDENGGEIHLEYRLENDSQTIGENTLHLHIQTTDNAGG